MVVSFGPLPDGRFWLKWDLGAGQVSEETISAELADSIFRMLLSRSEEAEKGQSNSPEVFTPGRP